MSHLSPEELASLIDEAPTAAQASHLEQCASCRSELSAVRRVVALGAAERTRPGLPLTSWASLSQALRAEGVPIGTPAAPPALTVSSGGGRQLTDAGVTGPVRPLHTESGVVGSVRHLHAVSPRARVARWGGMAAAAALLVTIGVAGGRWSAARDDVQTAATGLAVAAGAGAGAGGVTPVAQVRSEEDARAMLHAAETQYAQALGWLAANDSAMAPRQIVGVGQVEQQYRQRLEVLDAAMSQARQALYEAPDDPVMNRYYLATMGARQVLLRRLTSVLPATQQVVEY